MDEPILIKAKAIKQRASDGCVTVEVDTVAGKLRMFVYPEQIVAERKGKWINIVDGTEYTWGTCDSCGARIPMVYKYYKYCPNCGMKNEVTT